MLQLDTNYFKKNEMCAGSGSGTHPGKLQVATATHVYYLDIKDIVRIQSISNYSKLFFSGGQTLTVSKVLSHFDELLSGSHFSRIHRTHLVNLLYIKQYVHGNEAKIGMSNDEMLPVARRKKKMFQQKMMLFSR
jgi:two-component system LytT family response regulator